jgi:hypothetical protein
VSGRVKRFFIGFFGALAVMAAAACVLALIFAAAMFIGPVAIILFAALVAAAVAGLLISEDRL